MARKRQRYRRVRRPSTASDNGLDDREVAAAARELAATRTVEELRNLVGEAREAADYADSQAQENPGPEALRQFRAAARLSAEAEQALALAREADLPT